MSSAQKRRIRRRRKIARSTRKTLMEIILAPGRLPRITGHIADMIMRYCEASALIFVCALIVHLMVPEVVGAAIVYLTGIVFAFLAMLILLADYQDKLAEYRLFGFRL